MKSPKEQHEFQAVTWIAQQLVQGRSQEDIVQQVTTKKNPKEKSEQQVATIDMLVRKFAGGDYAKFSEKKKKELLGMFAEPIL
jgi:hypothetical protein